MLARLIIVIGVLPLLLAACTASTGTRGLSVADTAVVRAALAADAAAAGVRDRETESIPAAQAVTDYVVALDAIDLSDAPSDFVSALRAHRDAWAALIGPLESRSTERGEMHALFDRLTAPSDPMHVEFQRLIDRVWATWGPVEAAARRAGVRP